MKRAYRIISIVVLICFLFNSVLFAVDINPPIASQTNINKLATPSMCDDLVEIEHIEHKDIGRIKFALRAYLKKTPMWMISHGDANPHVRENTIFSPAGMQFFFNERRILPNGDIFLMARIKDEKARPKLRTYYVILTLQKEKNKPGETIIKEVYTEKEYKKFGHLIEKPEKLPQRKPEDKKAIKRYVQHERIIDRWIRKKMKDPDNYFKIRLHTTYGEILDMKDFLSLAFAPYSDYPTYTDAGVLCHMNDAFLGENEFFPGKLMNILLGRTLVLIKVKKDEPKPIIYENGMPIKVGSHTSKNAIYIFVDDDKEFLSFDNLKSYLKFGVMFDKDKKSFRGAFFAGYPARAIIGEKINPKLAHEIGVICGLDYEVTEDGSIINDMDRLYEAARGKTREEVKQLALVEKLKDKLSPVNLDYLRGTPERPYERDYAFITLPEDGDEAEGVSPRAEECIRRITDIWNAVGEKKIIDEPFNTEVQKGLREILHLIELKAADGIPLPLDISYKIFYAQLFHRGDYKMVINFFDAIKEKIGKNTLFREAILDNKDFLMLYFTARMMDRDSVSRAVSAGEDFIVFYTEELFGYASDPEIIPGFSIDDTANFIGTVIKNVFDFIYTYKANKKYEEALKLVRTCTICFRNEYELSSSETFIRTMDEILEELAILRNKIIAERNAEAGTAAWQGASEVGPDEGEAISGEIERLVNAAWENAGEKINEPFSREAQRAFGQILQLTNITTRPKSLITANADTYYKICTASLFGAGDCKNVVSFFEWVRDLPEWARNLPGEFGEFRSGVLGSNSFRTLYFTACRLDRKTIEEAAQKEMGFYDYSTKRLLSGDDIFMTEFLQTQYREEDFQDNIVIFIRGLIDLFKHRKDYDKALEIVENNIFLVESQSKFDPDMKAALEKGFLNHHYAERRIIRIWQIILSRYSLEEVKPEHVKLVIVRAEEKGLKTEEEILNEYGRVKRWGGFARLTRGRREENYGTGEELPEATLEKRKQLAIEEISESFTAAKLRWLRRLMVEKYQTDRRWQNAHWKEKLDDRLCLFGEILTRHNVWDTIPDKLPYRIGPKMLEEAAILRQGRIIGHLNKIVEPLAYQEVIIDETKKLAKYGQDALIALSLIWDSVKDKPTLSFCHEIAMRELIINLLTEKAELGYVYANILTEHILKAFNPRVLAKSSHLRQAGQHLVTYSKALKALKVLLELVPGKLGSKAFGPVKQAWTELKIRAKLEELSEIVKKFQPGGTAAQQDDGKANPDEFTARKTIAEMTTIANEVGIKIAPPVSRYKLFVPYSFYKSDEEYEYDEKEYGDRFGLVRIGTDKSDKIVRWVLQFINDNSLKPKDVIVQLPKRFANNEFKVQLNKLTASGIKFVIVTTKGMNDIRNKEKIKEYRHNILQIMRLVRKIDKDTLKDSKLYRLLRFYIEGHLLGIGGNSTLVDDYMEAIMQNDVACLLNYILSYKPTSRFEWRDYKLITETLRYA